MQLLELQSYLQYTISFMALKIKRQGILNNFGQKKNIWVPRITQNIFT